MRSPVESADRIPGLTLSTVQPDLTIRTSSSLARGTHWTLGPLRDGSTKPNASYATGLRRLGFTVEATRFFDAHVVADATHEVIALEQLLEGLVDNETAIEPDVAFGATSLAYLDGLFTARLLDAWRIGRFSRLP